jgi:hypothetical protein
MALKSSVTSGVSTYFRYVGGFALFVTALFIVLFRFDIILYVLGVLFLLFAIMFLIFYDWRSTVQEDSSTVIFQY